jgi:hypothetical protein
MSATAAKTGKASANGNAKGEPTPDLLAEAIAYEDQIGADAAEIRGDETELTRRLYLQLLPLLRRPIPAGFIVTTGVVTGKPYESTGIKSLQVQIDRLDNVLTPLAWGWSVEYEQDGQLAHARAWVGADPDEPFVVREARGGVNRGSTIGNLYKGSETNAAKLALARLGPGHEVYLGAADFDPDVDVDAAKEQAKTQGEESGPRKLPAEKVETLKATITEAGLDPFLEMKLRSFGVAAIEDLNVDQGIAIWEWVQSERTSG